MSRTWPQFSKAEIQAVTKVLESGKVNYWTGEECHLFEKEFASYVGAEHAIAMMNGTVTIEAALKVLGVGVGDEVVVPSHTFVATATAVVACGAVPVFADIELNTNNVSAETIKAVLSEKTKAIIVVHLAGLPCDMDSILALAGQRNLRIIEDCAQAHGALYKGQHVGTFGDIGSFSFCQDKIMTTGGEGGMVVTNNEELWKKMWAYKDHGKSYDAVYNKEHPPGFRWLVESFGTNFRMTEMQATIGRLQLKELPYWTKKRNENAEILTSKFKDLSAVRLIDTPGNIRHACYKFYAFMCPERLKEDWTRDKVIKEIQSQGVPCFQGGCSEIYRESVFVDQNLGPRERLPNAKVSGETAFQLLIHPTLSREDMNRMAAAVAKTILKATK